jgi:hypothetical protein
MPRFAANLSFNPLEPLKPSTAALAPTSSSASNKVDISAPQTLKPTSTATNGQQEVIPEVEFDWNSSGLVNPLDGELNSLIKFISMCRLLFEPWNVSLLNFRI